MMTNKNEATRILKQFISCLHFATEAHKNQKRKDPEKTPYINHPIGVAYIVSEEAGILNLDLTMGCLLHDTVEDTEIVLEDIKHEFGDYVYNLIQEVTDNKQLPRQKRKELQIIHARTSSPQAKIVKLADKLYNLRDLERTMPEGWSEERKIEYYEWALQVCTGLQGVCPRLEVKLRELFESKHLMMPPRQPNEGVIDVPIWEEHPQLKPLVYASNLAATRHSSHLIFDVDDGLPYINHLVSVLHILSEEANIEDVNVLSAAILCDVVGMAKTSEDEITVGLGREVSKLVSELTYNHSGSLKEQLKSQMYRVGRMSSHAAKLITLAGLVDKCRRLEVFDPKGLPQEHKLQYFQGAKQLANILEGTHRALEQVLDHIWVNQGVS